MALKFRPALTLAELDRILHRLEPIPDQSLINKLSVLRFKATAGITKPSHLATGKPSLEAQLGLEDDDTIVTLIEQFNRDPSVLSPSQLSRVRHHRYLSDMMSPTEEAEYESLQAGL